MQELTFIFILVQKKPSDEGFLVKVNLLTVLCFLNPYSGPVPPHSSGRRR